MTREQDTSRFSNVVLPEYVKACTVCEGEGRYVQSYNAGCGGGFFSSLGECDYCEGTGLIMKQTGVSAPLSVVNQIEQQLLAVKQEPDNWEDKRRELTYG